VLFFGEKIHTLLLSQNPNPLLPACELIDVYRDGKGVKPAFWYLQFFCGSIIEKEIYLTYHPILYTRTDTEKMNVTTSNMLASLFVPIHPILPSVQTKGEKDQGG
jgi:hypothetical protein